ncbi:phosphotransferase family protein [Glycomyces sp. YM15]|uniref:phosphotransferase family protein n=1 Tax=Glycomyces sp. YM15 TaxID=2800446 RepID=UPI00196378C2|nr:phosphotransferase [Glycomyces sp. YM15]
MTRFGAPPSLDATANRPSYADLPAPVRHRIARELGDEPDSIRIAGGGFTKGFAARVRSGSGTEYFIKAAGPKTPEVQAMYRQEARYSAALPSGVPAPEVVFTDEVEDWTVTGFEAVQGDPVTLPMAPETVRQLLDAWAQAADALDPPPTALVQLGIGVKTGRSLKAFNAVASGEQPPFALPPRLQGRIDELAAFEAQIDTVIASDRISHTDLRPDNMLIGDGRAWICDWTSPRYMAPWVDTTLMLLTVHGDGHDADSLFWRHPTAVEVTDEQLDTMLAAMTGGLLRGWSDRPENLISPAVDHMMRWSGLAAADWLANRRGW